MLNDKSIVSGRSLRASAARQVASARFSSARSPRKAPQGPLLITAELSDRLLAEAAEVGAHPPSNSSAAHFLRGLLANINDASVVSARLVSVLSCHATHRGYRPRSTPPDWIAFVTDVFPDLPLSASPFVDQAGTTPGGAPPMRWHAPNGATCSTPSRQSGRWGD